MLPLEERAVYRCALWVARNRGQLRNVKLIEQVASIVIRLLSTFRARAVRAGRARAERLIASLSASGLSRLAPEILGWFNESGFILYLGVLEVNV